MNNYLTLASKYLSAHRKKTRLQILSVALSVALVAGIFSMLDVFLEFEKQQIKLDKGNYHIAIKNATDQEISIIKNRIEVKNSGMWKSLGDGEINGLKCELGTIEKKFAENLNIQLIEGTYPTKENEIMLEKWATEKLYLDVNIGDIVLISNNTHENKEYIVSGIFNDNGSMKANGILGVMLSNIGAARIESDEDSIYCIEFKEKIKIKKVVSDIKNTLNIEEGRIIYNNQLLAVMGQSEHNAALQIYGVGAVLFCIVLVAGIIMIYNTFNISVTDRVRQFGLLRCIGASQSQIKKLVRIEGVEISFRAIPIGIIAGMILTFIGSAILKFFNNNYFNNIPLFSISIIGVVMGIMVGFLTVLIASFLPAKKAAQVSPVNAVTGNEDIKIHKKIKQGFLTRMLPVEMGMGINNAFIKKKTLFLMSSSIAISIIMFFGFNALVTFMHTAMKTTKPYTPDISLISQQGIEDSMYTALDDIEGVKNVYGRKASYITTTFLASRLSDSYKKQLNKKILIEKGLYTPSIKSLLVSYDQQQLEWSKNDLIEGELSAEKLNQKNGVIVVSKHFANGIDTQNVNFKYGDKILFQTPNGKKELTVMAILRQVPINNKEDSLTTFITTEELFVNLLGDSLYKEVDIKIKHKNNERVVEQIENMMDETITFLDKRQENDEINKTFLTFAVFIYGFVFAIALVSILNIINTMNTSIAAKTRYLGVMRATGMTCKQINKMVTVESMAYTTSGCVVGCILGVILQKTLIIKGFSELNIIWKFPIAQIILVIVTCILVTRISVISPLKKIKSKNISEALTIL